MGTRWEIAFKAGQVFCDHLRGSYSCKGKTWQLLPVAKPRGEVRCPGLPGVLEPVLGPSALALASALTTRYISSLGP